ncbi:MAG TPA: alpha/beta fold hydrolase [Steroidobacteraceae bacterium]
MNRYAFEERFHPPWWLRSAHLQTVLVSMALRRPAIRRRARALLAASTQIVLDCGDGVRLQCFHAAPPAGAHRGERGLVVLLHGWEGSADSLYILSLAQQLLTAGFEVVRLNLRDHGATHHLNRELFHSCRLPEVVGAVQALAARFTQRPMSLVGFSLGGNFVLRIAALAHTQAVQLQMAIAVSPVIDPQKTLYALEFGPALYHHYFIRKWSSSLRRKQLAWPGRYDFARTAALRNLRQMTAELVRHHTEYPSLEAYLAGYAITGPRLAGLEVPALILTAADDPIIPAGDLERLASPPALRIVVTRHGGHCGFLDTLTAPSFADRFVLQALSGPPRP